MTTVFLSEVLCSSECVSGLCVGAASPSKRHTAAAAAAGGAVRKVGVKDVLKVINDVNCSTSRLVSTSTSSSSSSSSCSSCCVKLPLQQSVAVCTLVMMTDAGRPSQRLINSEVTLGKVDPASAHPLSILLLMLTSALWT